MIEKTTIAKVKNVFDETGAKNFTLHSLNPGIFITLQILDVVASLAPTPVSQLVRPQHFQITRFPLCENKISAESPGYGVTHDH